MKKLITLLIAAGAFATLNAQTSRDEARKVILGQDKRNGSGSGEGRDVILGGGNRNDYPTYPNSYPTGSREAQVDQVNREYDQKIWSIRNNNTLSADEKARMIRQLEQDRSRRIRQINQSQGGDYGKNGKRNDDDDYRNKGYGKKDNGRHLGWEKGKGNPHKNGGKPGKGKKG